MQLKNLGYLAFTGLCLGGAAALISQSGRPAPAPRGDWVNATYLLADAPPATRPAAPAPAVAPLPTVPAPVVQSSEVAGVLGDRLSSAPKLGEAREYSLAEHRDLPSKHVDATNRPLLTPVQFVARQPLPAKLPTTRPVPSTLQGAAPLASAPPVPPRQIAMAVRARFSMSEAEPLLPPLRIPLVVRPRPEEPSRSQGPILNVNGNDALHMLPVFRTAPAPSAKVVDPFAGQYPEPVAEPAPDNDPPAPAVTMPPRPPMPTGK